MFEHKFRFTYNKQVIEYNLKYITQNQKTQNPQLQKVFENPIFINRFINVN